MTYRQTADFLLYDWLGVESLTDRARFADHSRETFSSVMDTCEKMAREKFYPHNRLSDTEEPWFDGERVHLPEPSVAANRAYAESGMLAAAQDYEIGGMQLPCVVQMAPTASSRKAGSGRRRRHADQRQRQLLMVHGTDGTEGSVRDARVLRPFQRHDVPVGAAGRLEPVGHRDPRRAGRSRLRSDPLGPRFRLRGNKMWISNGEHELAENIIHLVLAKIPGPTASRSRHERHLAVHRAEEAGRCEGRADRRAQRRRAGRPQPQARLPRHPEHAAQFRRGQVPGTRRDGGGLDGQGAGAIGYLVGKPHEGLRCMFHMMNEARIAVGLGATMLGYAGYEASLDYAKSRPQGRPTGVGGKDPTRPQVPIIRHADIKRMLLARRATAKARSRSSCTARAWSTSSAPVQPRRRPRRRCCSRC
jgi:butyryl-CoA dehydrogenase